MRNISLFIPLIMLFTSCEKKELPVPKHSSGNVTTATVNMFADYRYQIYFDLKTNTVVGQNLKTAWDLGFESSGQGTRIILNSAKAMYAFNTGISDFNSLTDTSGFSSGKKFDPASGNLDSTAIGDWQSAGTVFILDRGFNESGIHQGFRKIIFEAVDAQKYSVKFAQLNGSGLTELEILKDSSYNFSFLSFTSNSVVQIEPPKNQWDIVFTQYLEQLSTPYLVAGCRLNHYNTSARMDSLLQFNLVDYAVASALNLDSRLNVIGYEWKVYNFSTALYEVFPQYIYLIRDQEGYYYKLHFIDFYDVSGNKGNPKWEYQQL